MSCMEGKVWIKYYESVLESFYDWDGGTYLLHYKSVLWAI